MAIFSPFPILPISQEHFAKLDYQVMRHAFDCQNELGRLCDEIIYQNDLAARLQIAGLSPVRTRVPVTITHLDFAKTYYLDLLVGDSAIYELKTVACLTGEHDSQALNYLFLCRSHHGKLVNFRPSQVESKFINTRITPEARMDLNFDMARWQEKDESSKRLREITVALLRDWGGFLELPLYIEAVVHFLGGESNVLQKIPLSRNGVRLGHQRLHLAGPGTAFRLTAMTESVESYEQQLRALLKLTPLDAIQWINMAHHQISFATVSR